MPWELFLCLVFLTGVRSQCSRQDYQYCVKLADPLLRDPHLIYPDNARDVEHVCRTWSFFVDCVKQYTDRCFTEAKRMEFNKAVEMPVNSIHRLCSMPDYRIDYMKHASCMKMTLTHDDYCGRHYKLLVSQVSGEAGSTSICCSHHLFRECVLDQTRNSCEAEAEVFSAQVLDKALSFLKNQCVHFVPSQLDCPGSEFYRTDTSRSDMSSTTTVHQIVHLQQHHPLQHQQPQRDPVEEKQPSTMSTRHWNPPSAPSRGSSSWTKHDWVTSWMPDDRGKTTEATGEATHSTGTVSAPPGERTTFGRMDWDKGPATEPLTNTGQQGSNSAGTSSSGGSQGTNSGNPGTNTGMQGTNQQGTDSQNQPNVSSTKKPPNWRPYTPHNTWYPSSKANEYKETNAIDEPNQQGLGSNLPDNSVSSPLPPRDVIMLTLIFIFVAR